MDAFKAIGLNDFQLTIVGNSLAKEINHTLITLIPKIDKIYNMKNFILISLFNVVYKTVAKILAYKYLDVMQKFVHPCQSNFILSRKGSNKLLLR
ncbi:hypothetical protein CR513_04284, partial [Mucuna pruriens]